jgi:glycosyltransferase involved in cell wall biosynthesis
MKIGIIGNVNNNNFSLMRYFRDLGADAHLLLYSNDGSGNMAHFKPSEDTWDLRKWTPYIHNTKIINAPLSALKFPYSYLVFLNYLVKKIFSPKRGNVSLTRPISNYELKKIFADYDILIGCGIAPAMLDRVKMSLTIFSPYATGIEYFKNTEFTAQLNSLNSFGALLMRQVQARQISGLKKVKYLLDSDSGISFEALKRIGIAPRPLSIPMVYSGEQLPTEPPSKILENALLRINNSEFSVLHHARLCWVRSANFTNEEWLHQGKNSDWLIKAFSLLIKHRQGINPCLFIVEYGPDIEHTKRLVANCGIESYVHWLPIMPRRELMWLISKVSVGVGEFYDIPRAMWGGTGWEALASGKPLLQGFNFHDQEFDSIYGHPPPPMLSVRCEDDVLQQLLFAFDHPEEVVQIGKRARAWFDEYNGVALASKWLALVTEAISTAESTDETLS